MIKQCMASLAVTVVAAALAASARAQSDLPALSPSAQAEIQKLSPAQRAALAHSLLGDAPAATNPAATNPPSGAAAASTSVAQAGGDASAAPAAGMAPMPSAAAYNWTGCYVAAGAGVGVLTDNHQLNTNTPPITQTAQSTSGGDGVLGRFGAGCDWQIRSRFVAGAFGDVDITSISGDFGVPAGVVSTESEPYAWALGVRGGYLFLPQLLGYLDVGFTQAHFNFGQFNIAIAGGGGTGLSLPGYDANGWFAGAGFELALDFWPGAFWRNEYRFAYYPSSTQSYTGFLVAAGQVHEKVQPVVQTVTTSLVYKFDLIR